MRVVSTHHMVNSEKSGNAKAHAAYHVIVENQVAIGFGPTVRAFERLQQQGLSRHECIHAVGSVIAEHLFSTMRETEAVDSKDVQAQINAAIERLDANEWRKTFDQ